LFGSDLLIPPGGVLLHIGPHKTGTTAIQSAFRRIPERKLREHGVVYAGEGRIHMRLASLAITGRKGLAGDWERSDDDWNRVVTQVRSASDLRVIVSSEFFCEADDERAKRLIHDLGDERVHVVITLRHLGRILPSSWQQFVRNRMTKPYDEWLEKTLKGEQFRSPTPAFWRRHRHDALVERWAALVGADNLAVVVLDESDRSMPLHTFEAMTGLPRDFLVAENSRANRSLTAAEVELVRQINEVADKERWSDRAYHHYIRQGVIGRMGHCAVGPDEQPIQTPQWALDRAQEIGAAAARRIAELGVHVAGDLDSLGAALHADTTPRALPASALPVERVREAVVGTLHAFGASTTEQIQGQAIGRASTRELVTILRHRAINRLRGRDATPPPPPPGKRPGKKPAPGKKGASPAQKDAPSSKKLSP